MDESTALRARVAELEARWKIVEEFLNDGSFRASLKDPHGRYLFANRQEGPVEIGSTAADRWPLPVAEPILRNDAEALSCLTVTRTTETLPGPTHLESFRKAVNHNGAPLLATVSFDITHHTTKLRRMFESNIIGVIEFDSHHLLDANDSFLSMLGHPRESLAAGLACETLTHPKYRDIEALALQRMLREGTFPPFEKEMIHRDGSLIPVWIGGALLQSGDRWTSIAFILDLTERKCLERQLLSAQKLQTLGLLSSAISHDFNNLLTTIMGHASLAMENLTPGHVARPALEEVLRGSRMASDLTQQLLSYTGKATAAVRPISLTTLVREMSGLLELPVPRKVELTLTLAENLPPISADPTQIHQIVMNLVINAADAIGDNEGAIHVRSGEADYSPADLAHMTVGAELPGGRYVSLIVTDNGCGMNPATLERIFDPLFTTKTRGWGLGLAAVQGIIRSHRGALHVQSQVGVGTAFTVLFPAVHSEIPAIPPAEIPEVSGNQLILVVDDEPSVLRLAEATLNRYGYRALLARDGAAAVELFRERSAEISLVVLDLAMPVMGGEEARTALLAIRPDVRILISSGYNETETLGRLAGCRFMQKPYTARQLAEQIHQALED